MTQYKRSIWDDLVEIGQEILEKIDELLDPAAKQRKPVRVPVPVRSNQPLREPYNDPNR